MGVYARGGLFARREPRFPRKSCAFSDKEERK